MEAVSQTEITIEGVEWLAIGNEKKNSTLERKKLKMPYYICSAPSAQTEQRIGNATRITKSQLLILYRRRLFTRKLVS